MAKRPVNQGKLWTKDGESRMKKLVGQNTPTDLLAYKLGRSEDAVRSKAQEMGISLKPTNKHPDKRRGH